MRIVGQVAQLVGVDGGQHVGGAQRLPDITLALRLAHVEDVVPDSVRGRRHLLAAVGLHGDCHRDLLTRRAWLVSEGGGFGGGGLLGQLALARPPVSGVTSAAARPIAA